MSSINAHYGLDFDNATYFTEISVDNGYRALFTAESSGSLSPSSNPLAAIAVDGTALLTFGDDDTVTVDPLQFFPSTPTPNSNLPIFLNLEYNISQTDSYWDNSTGAGWVELYTNTVNNGSIRLALHPETGSFEALTHFSDEMILFAQRLNGPVTTQDLVLIDHEGAGVFSLANAGLDITNIDYSGLRTFAAQKAHITENVYSDNLGGVLAPINVHVPFVAAGFLEGLITESFDGTFRTFLFLDEISAAQSRARATVSFESDTAFFDTSVVVAIPG